MMTVPGATAAKLAVTVLFPSTVTVVEALLRLATPVPVQLLNT